MKFKEIRMGKQIVNLNRKWAFSKECEAVPMVMPERWYWVNLPHTWNHIDGQDGNNDLYRGTAFYAKTVQKIDLPKTDCYIMEVNGANSSAKLYWNGKWIAEHHGGYSTWRVDVTEVIEDTNLIVFEVDNAINQEVYPQNADFTFYGGLYRDVNLICTSESHFDLSYYGGKGIMVTPVIKDKDAEISVEVWVQNRKENQMLHYTVRNQEGKSIAKLVTKETKALFTLKEVHKWNGKKDPYLYSVEVELYQEKNCVDSVFSYFGCRSFQIDAERGFLLNGEEYPLRGMSRHQDWWGIGNALLPEHHEKDMELFCEIGATSVRLAHYQHDQYFYDLCDKNGIIVWAEIPYISSHLENGTENTIQQMKELIVQNYNHPSIVVWGLSNELNIGKSPENDALIIENHCKLNELVHHMDKTRLTTMACVSSCDSGHAYVAIPDTVAFNHYFGWYGGELDDYGIWFDKFHEEYPKRPVGISEYGCEALNWHNSNPEAGDYSEEYQAVYHEALIKQLYSRKYLWASYVWNMFDFGADARNEGGENGQNHKGLVTLDRKYKKDAFYAYKAWLSDEPFVHICGKRYVDRVEDVTKVTVYSNQPTVELFANDKSLGIMEAEDHFFYFEVPNSGETVLHAVAGSVKDKSFIRKVEKPNRAYRLVERGAILNWWDITEIDGYASLNTKVKLLIENIGAEKTAELAAAIIGVKLDAKTLGGLSGVTMIRLTTSIAGMIGVPVTKEQLLKLNEELNKIKVVE